MHGFAAGRDDEGHRPVDALEQIGAQPFDVDIAVGGEKHRVDHNIIFRAQGVKLLGVGREVDRHRVVGLKYVGIPGYGVGQRRAVAHDYQSVGRGGYLAQGASARFEG